MTIDKSLRTRKGIVRARNVLTRAERIERLTQQDKWNEDEGVFGLAKVRVYRVIVKKKKKKKGEEEGAETTATAAATKAGAAAKSPAATKTAAGAKAAPSKPTATTKKR
ncbi:MAG: small basic protein [Planctomycetaceae bacterium]|jgi:small basic protein (TIGR04137 family)|nr:small basic protein [Planctomycetaceae bacterium]